MRLSNRGSSTQEKRLIVDFKQCNLLGNCTCHDEVRVGIGRILKEHEVKYIKDTRSGKPRIIRRTDPEFQELLHLVHKTGVKSPVPARSIDLVCETSKNIWLLETKVTLNCEAIGQVLQDEVLYKNERKPTKPLKLGVICEESDPYLEEVCQKHRITIFEKAGDSFNSLGHQPRRCAR